MRSDNQLIPPAGLDLTELTNIMNLLNNPPNGLMARKRHQMI